MANYKSLQVAEALQRVSQQIKPKVTIGSLENSVFATNTNTPDATVNTVNELKKEQQYYNSIYSKTGSDYARDAALALGKGIVAVPQAGAGLIDLADAGLQGLLSDAPVQGGRFTKALEDTGIRFQETQDILHGLYSEGTQKQFEGLAALPGMSTDKSLGDNLSSLGQTAKYVLQNPSLAANAVVESLPLIGAGGAIGRGVASLGAQGAKVAGAVGEGSVMAGSAMANMPKDEQGYSTGNQALGALGIGILGGAIGQVGNRFANRHGAADIDSVSAGVANTGNQGFKSLGIGTLTEASEEAAQTALENVVTNMTSGRDAIEGLNQDLVLGTFAGGIMGAGTNLRGSLKSEALNAVLNVATKQAEKIKERVTKAAPEKSDIPTSEFIDPSSTNYNPTAAVARMAQSIKPESTPEEVAQVKQGIDLTIETAEQHLESLVSTQEVLSQLDVNRNKVASINANLERIPEEQRPQFEAMRDAIQTQVEEAEKFVGKEDQLTQAVEQAQTKVNEVRDMYSKYSGLLDQASTTDTQEAPQERVDQIFAAPTSFSLEDIQTELSNPTVPEEKKLVLRQLADAVVAQNAVKDIDAVNKQVVGKQFDPNYRSTPQYLEQFTTAIKNGSRPAQANLLREIKSFEQSHTGKSEALAVAIETAQSTGKPAQIVRTKDGQWVVETKDIIKGAEAKKNGAYLVHASPKGMAAATKVAEYMDAESNAITATRTAMEALQGATAPTQTQQAPTAQSVDPMVGSEAIPTDTTTTQAPINTVDNSDLDTPVFDDPMQAELDAFNLDARSNNEWNPGSRTEDPRKSGKGTPATPSNPVSQEATQTPKQTAKPKVEIPDVPPALGEVVFDESGVGSASEEVPTIHTVQANNKYKMYSLPDSTNAWTFNKAYAESEYNRKGKGKGKAPTQILANGSFILKEGKEGLIPGLVIFNEQSSKDTAKASEATEVSVSEPVVAEAKPSVTKEMAEDILEGKFSSDTHTIYQKEDGNWDVRKKTFDEMLDDLPNEVEAFDDYEPQVDEDGEKSAITTTEVETEDEVSEPSARDIERAKPIQDRNLIVDGFNRKATPLAQVPNLSNYLDNPARISKVIQKLTDIEPKQNHIENVQQFKRFREAVAKHINGSVKVRRIANPDHAQYNWQDYLQFLVKDDGTFDEDVITAVALSGYLYIAENSEAQTKSEKDVASLLRLKNVDSVPPHIYDRLADIGDHRNLTMASLGQRVNAALGYKQLSDVSEVRTGKLNDALGSLVLRSLRDMNLIEESTMPRADFDAMRSELVDEQGARQESAEGYAPEGVYNFVRITDTAGVAKIASVNEKTNSVLTKMFAVKSEFTMPVLEAPKDLIKSTFNDKGTAYPSEAVETTKISQARPYGFMGEMLKVTDNLRALDEVEYKRMFGFMTENEVASMQVMKQLGQKSVNESIERSLRIVDEFRNDLSSKQLGMHTPFYLPQFLVSNTRSHYDSDLNPQADKIHRGLVGMKEHEVELDTNQQYFTSEGITQMGRFMQAVAMNIEEAPIYKGNTTIDKADYKQFIPAMLQYLETPKVVNAIKAMQNVQKGKATHADLTAISAFVKEGGMKMQSLKALQALADFDSAKEHGSKFITDITFESDGVTNGPFLTGISTNTLAREARNAGGLFRDESLMSVPEYKDKGGKDLYEFLGEEMLKIWEATKKDLKENGKPMVNAAVAALDTLYPAFGKRKGAKPITTTANYGAGDNSIKAANAREVISSLIDKLDTTDIDKALPFINAANQIIDYMDVLAKFKAKEAGKKHTPIERIPTNMNPKQIKLTPEQMGAIFEMSKRSHGTVIEESLKVGLGSFIPVRNTLTNHASLAFEFFDVLREDALEAAQERAIQEKTLELFNGKPIESISVKEKNRAMREIAKYTPTITNAMASVSSNKAQSSTPLMKTEKVLLPGKLGENELHFKDKSMKTHAQISVPANPGVSGLALAVQSMDSFVTHFVMKRLASQNYHDANASSIKDATKMAQLQNEGVFRALTSMHLSTGMLKAFLNSASGAFELGSITELNPKITEALNKLVGNSDKEVPLSNFDLSTYLKLEVKAAFDRDMAKLTELAKEKYIGQYGTQEGHYTVTEADVKAIEKEIKKLNADRIRQLEVADKLGKDINNITGYKAPAKSAVSIDMIMQGGVSYSNLRSQLLAELKQYDKVHHTDARRFSALFQELIPMIDASVNSDIKLKGISVFSPDSDGIPNIKRVRDERISAWYGKDAQGNEAIYFAEEAGMPTAKTIIHELLHAGTVSAIEQFRTNPDKYPDGKRALDRIEKLLNNVKNKVNKDPNASDTVKYAVTNVEEFIATGLTYPEFVDYLAKTQVQSGSRSKIKLSDGFAEFIKSIADVITAFIKKPAFQSTRMISALEALVYDTTDLIQQKSAIPVLAPDLSVQGKLFGAPHKAGQQVSSFTSKQVFDALETRVDPSFSNHLSEMMTRVSDTIYSGLDSNLVEDKTGTWTPEEAWEDFIDQGKAFTTESATTAGFRISDREAFAIESLYTALKHSMKDKAMHNIVAEMTKAFNASAKRMTAESFYQGDWATATSADKADAQAMYDYVFKYGPSNPDPLARFVSLALGSEQFNKLLGFTVRDTESSADTTFEKLVEGTNSVLDYVSGLMTNSHWAQNVNTKLATLSKELARIDIKNRSLAVNKVAESIDKAADYTDDLAQKARDKIVELAEHKAVADSRFTSVRFASNTTRLAARGDLWTVLDTLKDLRTLDDPNTKLGFMGELINEAANNDSVKNSVEAMLRHTKLNNQTKENIRDTTRKNVLSTFEENGSYLDKDTKHALTQMLRVDVQSLLHSHSVNDIAKLYSDNRYLNSEIGSLENQAKRLSPDAQTMINRAQQLAKYMVTGKGSNGLAKNAQLIVSGFNSGEVVPKSDPLVGIMDSLATMYGIQYTPAVVKSRVNKVAKRELKNQVNGFDTVIKFHKDLSESAANSLFMDNETSLIKGFVPDITNPNREVRVATNPDEAKLLKSQFFKEVKTLGKDKKDGRSNDVKLFLNEEANIQRLVSGAVELVSTGRKGTVVNMDAKQLANTINQVANSIPNSPNYNPMNDPDIYMIPSYDTQGNVIGFSYEMAADTRDSLLERNNDFSDLLGAYAATNFNKTTVPEQNERVIDALFEEYSSNFVENPRAYVEISPNAKDPGLSEIWAMLPESTRKHAESVFGSKKMIVRNDVLLTVFGYRKHSINHAFDKMEDAKSMFEKLYTGIMEELFGSNAKVRGVQAERSWQEAVALMKDIIVIRNVKTMVFNTISNSLLLMTHGVSPQDILKDTVLSVRAGIKYRKDMANLMSAQQRLRAGVGDAAKLEQEILKLEDEISRNPLKGFIEEGMMPTIVEDVDPDTNHYSYKSKAAERVSEYTDNIPKSIRTVAKWAAVSPDTPLYKFLNNATQFSDFSSKYVMYKYYTEKAKEKLDHKDALQIASDNFINYDVPTGKGLQYLNDMGIVMFSKYNIRIQKALFQIMKKRPATAMAQALLISSFTNMETALDPLIWFNIGSPIREGALGLPGALDEPLPIKMMSGMF